MYCSFGLWLRCIVDFQVLIHGSIYVFFWRTHFVHLIRSERMSLRKINGGAGRAAFIEPRCGSFCTSNSGVIGWGCWRNSVISTQLRFLLEVTGVEFVVRLYTDRGASSNGLWHVVAPLSLLEWHCVPSVWVRTAGEHHFLLKIMQGIGGQSWTRWSTVKTGNFSKHTTGHLFHLLKTDLTQLKKNNNYKLFYINLPFCEADAWHGVSFDTVTEGGYKWRQYFQRSSVRRLWYLNLIVFALWEKASSHR
jgi:hypothetical protein